MNKKGEDGSAYDLTRKSVYWAVAGVMLVIAVMIYVYFIGSMDSRLTYVSPKVYAEAISQRFANIPGCFAYQDPETERTYPGVIDLTKFTQDQMQKCYQTDLEKGYEDYNFRLLLKNKKVQVTTNNYFNADEFTLTKKVLLRDGENLILDEMIIYVQASTFKHKKVQVASG
jgi:hypothetical protein